MDWEQGAGSGSEIALDLAWSLLSLIAGGRVWLTTLWTDECSFNSKAPKCIYCCNFTF